MTPERLQQIEGIFNDALDRNESEQMDFVRRACGNDEDLCREVLSLLEAHYLADQHKTQPALELAAHELAVEQSRPAPLPQIENYDVISPLGRGGMGEVLLAKDKRLKRKVALKLLPSYYASNEERLRRFEQEALTASALTHPNILTVYEIGQTGDSYFIATEYVEGKTLRQRIREGALPLNEAIEIAIQVANALQAAHNAGIVHRDIKPDNIMIRPDGFVKILDFGIAKLTETSTSSLDLTTHPAGGFETKTGQVIGTPAYLSPEQARGLKIDGRSDLFSLGVVLFEMLIGKQPFAGPTSADVMVAILERDPVLPPQLNPGLKRILNRALHKSVEARYSNADEFVKDLRSLQQQTQSNTAAASATTKLDIPIISTTKSHRWRFPALAAAALIIAGLAAYRFWPVAAPPMPPQVVAAPVEVMSYSLEIADAKNKSVFSNGAAPLTAKQDFKFHFASKKDGFLYIIAPGKTNLPETFLTSQPQQELVKTNAITSGKDFIFPAEDEYWINLSKERTTTFSIVFSPTPLTSPTFFTQPSGRKLTISEQQEWDAFRQTNGLQQPSINTAQPRAVVSIPATQSDSQPVIFDVTVQIQ